ncbi:MAG: cytochrome c4 [Chromatiales bacterium]|nr:cytochrome c4 [Chromatiales bacterium]
MMIMMTRLFLLTSLMLVISGISAAENRTAIEIVKKRCSLCHGIDGEASSTIYPRLAGQNAAYVTKQLGDFKSGRRQGTMNEMAADLTPDEMVALGEYFSAKPTLTHRVRNKDFSAVGYYLYHNGNSYSDVPACESCHGVDGNGTTKLPRLAGQHKRYLMAQLLDFNTRKRTNDNAVMHSVASKLTELEINALALYISGM